MARPLRLNVPGGLYHVTARGVDRGPIFLDDQDRQLFLRLLAETVIRFGWLLHAFSLMLTHFHLMPETPRGNLSAGMGWLKGSYAAAFNHRHGRVGPLYDSRFWSRLIQDALYAQNSHHYIHRNPVEAGLVEVPWDDYWNSSRYFLGLEPAPRWLHLDWMLNQFQSREEYKEALLRADISALERQTIGGAIVGSRQFAAGFVTQTVLGDPNISGRLDLGRLWDPAEILSAMAAEGLDMDGVGPDRSEASFRRGLLMFLLRDLAGIPIAEVADHLGISKPGVSKRVALMRQRACEEPALREIVERIASRLSQPG